MLSGWLAITLVSAYLAALLALAMWGDRARAHAEGPRNRKLVYVLSSCIYCSGWSLCGSVGMASQHGLDFLAMYVGPVLAFVFGYPLLIRMVQLARAQNITSVADFVAARYGKSTVVAATFTIVIAMATIPYIALQIRVIARSLAIFVDARLPTAAQTGGAEAVIAVFIALALAGLTIAIGTRRLDATEHQTGLMLVIAVESVVKLLGILAVGMFVSWGMFKGIGELTEIVRNDPQIAGVIDKPPDLSLWIGCTLTTMITVFFLPRQFHVSVVENRNLGDVRTAAWFVPLYLVGLSLFVLPIAIAGLHVFPSSDVDRDFSMLALPVYASNAPVAGLGLIGNVSAATSSALLAIMTLAVMVSNDLTVPFLLRTETRRSREKRPHTPPILLLRRAAIGGIVMLALIFAELFQRGTLYWSGFLSLAGIAQIAPAALIGLFWRGGNARGAIGGVIIGLAVAAYTLLLPAVADASAVVTLGPLGLAALRPGDLFGLGLNPLAQGLIWSLAANVLAYCGLSLSRRPDTNERLQADRFVATRSVSFSNSLNLRGAAISVDDLLAGVARYLTEPTARRLFIEWHAAQNLPWDGRREADAQLIDYAETLIASSIGAASSRTVVALLLRKREISAAAARQIVDEAAFEIQNSRDVLQHAIDVASDGMAVFDADLRLVAWNRAFREMFELPLNLMHVGTPLDALVRSNAERGVYGDGPVDDFVAARLEALTRPTDGVRLYSASDGRVYDMRSVRLHNGGLFFTYRDATAQATSEEELEAENLTLERRVRERTEELEQLNVELVRAKAEAEDANVSKSRFLAAASHDLLQPLSAARLYTTSLRERLRLLALGDATSMLAANVDASLEAVEDILGALLEISHLDAGATRTEITSFAVRDMLRQLQLEFEPMARGRGLRLRFAASSLRVSSDRKLLRRMLQNLVSNAIKYTFEGSIVVGARRAGDRVRFEIYDTGIGIPKTKQTLIFREFERLPAAIESSTGAGLGLSIVERLSRVLQHEVTLRSVVRKGTMFAVTVPRAEDVVETGAGTAAAAAARPRSLEGLMVAAIDNEQHLLSAITLLLQGWDCVVASGTGLREIELALGSLERGPDVIVADYHIGETDGLQVIATLRARYGPRPAVLVTADRSPVIRDLANAADVRVLHKPLKPAALRALLSQWHLVKAAAE